MLWPGERSTLARSEKSITGRVGLRFSSTRLYMSMIVHGTGLLSRDESGSANEFVRDCAFEKEARKWSEYIIIFVRECSLKI